MVFCTYCGKSFTQDEDLERHIHRHINEAPFKCFTCHMSFSRREFRELHTRVQCRDEENKDDLPSSACENLPEGHKSYPTPSLISSTEEESPDSSEESINYPSKEAQSRRWPCSASDDSIAGYAGNWNELVDAEGVWSMRLAEPQQFRELNQYRLGMHTEPYETTEKYESNVFATPSLTPEEPRQGHDTELKDCLINDLMRKAHELLGYTHSEASQSCAWSDTSSDYTLSDEECESRPDVSQDASHGVSTFFLAHSDAPDGHQTYGQYRSGTLPNLTTHNEASSFNRGHKRKKDNRDERSEDSNGEKPKKRRKAPQPSGDLQRRRRFACPFYKRNPELHASCTSCVWPGFDTIARTKEHIYRKHVNHFCPRCHVEFESSEILLHHLARTERCDAVDEPFQQVGIDESQVQRLKVRLRGRVDEEKWRNIYRICHQLPDDAPTPSPYCNQDSLASQATEGYDQFLRNHLPGRIREILETEAEGNSRFTEIYSSLLERLPDVIREAQRDLYEIYNSQRTVTWLSQQRNQQNSPANTTTLGVRSERETSQLASPDVNVIGSPAPFEAPPNTDDSMTLNEMQQAHVLSSQRHGSALVDTQSEDATENNPSDPEPIASSDGAHDERAPTIVPHSELWDELTAASLAIWSDTEIDQFYQDSTPQMPQPLFPFHFFPVEQCG